MIVTLESDEVREILVQAMREKAAGLQGNVESDECYFIVTASGINVEDIEEVQFTAVL
jgi:hypothetical protein